MSISSARTLNGKANQILTFLNWIMPLRKRFRSNWALPELLSDSLASGVKHTQHTQPKVKLAR